MRDNIGVNRVVKQIKSVCFKGKRCVIKRKEYLVSSSSVSAERQTEQQLRLKQVEERVES